MYTNFFLNTSIFFDNGDQSLVSFIVIKNKYEQNYHKGPNVILGLLWLIGSSKRPRLFDTPEHPKRCQFDLLIGTFIIWG